MEYSSIAAVTSRTEGDGTADIQLTHHSSTPPLYHSPFGSPLSRDFYARDTNEVARDLLGRALVVNRPQGALAGAIVETEAYGPNDEANHAYRGQTARNSVMFGEPGHAYVYFSYGVHWMFNVVTVAEGVGEAVLIRALEPVAGIDQMHMNRGITELKRLCSGPGSLCKALGITIEHNGIDLTGDCVYVAGDPIRPLEIVTSKRIGITKSADLPWRYYLARSPFISRK